MSEGDTMSAENYYGRFRHVMGEMGWTCDGHEPEACGDCQKLYDQTAPAMLVTFNPYLKKKEDSDERPAYRW